MDWRRRGKAWYDGSILIGATAKAEINDIVVNKLFGDVADITPLEIFTMIASQKGGHTALAAGYIFVFACMCKLTFSCNAKAALRLAFAWRVEYSN